MVAALEQSAREPIDEQKQRAVADHTWAARAEQLSDWLEAI